MSCSQFKTNAIIIVVFQSLKKVSTLKILLAGNKENFLGVKYCLFLPVRSGDIQEFMVRDSYNNKAIPLLSFLKQTPIPTPPPLLGMQYIKRPWYSPCN